MSGGHQINFVAWPYLILVIKLLKIALYTLTLAS